MSRASAYRWLAQQLGVPEPMAHMATMDEQMCDGVVRACTVWIFKEALRG